MFLTCIVGQLWQSCCTLILTKFHLSQKCWTKSTTLGPNKVIEVSCQAAISGLAKMDWVDCDGISTSAFLAHPEWPKRSRCTSPPSKRTRYQLDHTATRLAADLKIHDTRIVIICSVISLVYLRCEKPTLTRKQTLKELRRMHIR